MKSGLGWFTFGGQFEIYWKRNYLFESRVWYGI